MPPPNLPDHLPEVKLSFAGRMLPRIGNLINSERAYRTLHSLFSEHLEIYEAFRVILLGQDRAPQGWVCIGKGGLTETVADPRLIFAAALTSLCTGIIVAHNHPSGCKLPSQSDIDLTRRLVAIGDIHQIEVVDHLILVRNGYFSFADEGLM